MESSQAWMTFHPAGGPLDEEMSAAQAELFSSGLSIGEGTKPSMNGEFGPASEGHWCF